MLPKVAIYCKRPHTPSSAPVWKVGRFWLFAHVNEEVKDDIRESAHQTFSYVVSAQRRHPGNALEACNKMLGTVNDTLR